MIPTIYSKSALYPAQMEHSLNKGSDGLEIQLLNELCNEKGVLEMNEVFDIENIKKDKIKVIHTPFEFLKHSFTIEHFIMNSDFRAMLRDICKFANSCSNGERVAVLMHSGMPLDYLNYTGILPKILLCVDTLLEQFPNINIVIENCCVLNNHVGNQIECFGNVFEAAILADEIRGTLCTDRVGSVLDVCHAGISCQTLDVMWNAYRPDLNPKFCLEDFFSKFANSCQLIHLADFKGTGIGSENHGISFTDETKEKCFQCLDLYHKYNYNCPITLEIAEEDYMDRKGLAQTLSIVKEYYNGGN